jgi:hypothetical protein
MQRGLGAVEHHRQLGLGGMQPAQPAIQSGKAGAAAETAIEPRAALGGAGQVCLEIGAKIPDPGKLDCP